MTQKLAERSSRSFDVAVVGGGAAGLSGAVALGRARRSVLVIDAGSPRNAPAGGVHNLLSRDGISPAELLRIGREEVGHYGGLVYDGAALDARKTESGFELTLDDGSLVTARRLLVTTGLVDELPEVTGVRQRWGRDVLHCPYCHGWEIRDQAVGILATGPLAVHQALLFRQWSSDVVLFRHTAPALGDEDAERLAALGIPVVEGVVDSLDVVDDRLTGVRLANGEVVPRQALVVGARMVARSQVLAGLGLHPTEHQFGVGEFVAADPTGLTTVPGVWVAGNVTDLMAQVVTAAAGGLTAAAAINGDLITEETNLAVATYRETRRAASRPGHEHDHGHDHGSVGADPSAADEVQFTAEFWDDRYRSVARIWSGNPNPHLVSTVTDLAPATALDVGSGEGADAIWLAGQGWRVTGVDVSTVALERAAARATEAGTEVADRITWQQVDVLSWDPAPLTFDLVSAQFMHLPPLELQALHRRLAAAVRPGGTLLIVGHHPSDLQTTMGRPSGAAQMMFTAEQVAATLDPTQWHIVATTPARQAVDPQGRTITIHDAVLHAVRRR